MHHWGDYMCGSRTACLFIAFVLVRWCVCKQVPRTHYSSSLLLFFPATAVEWTPGQFTFLSVLIYGRFLMWLWRWETLYKRGTQLFVGFTKSFIADTVVTLPTSRVRMEQLKDNLRQLMQ